MKKVLAVLLMVTLAAGLLAGCGSAGEGSNPEATSPQATVGTGEATEPANLEPEVQPATIRLGGLKGPTSMGLVKLLKDAEEGSAFNEYEFTIAGAADELTPKLAQGQLDIAAVPANLAAVLYNNTKGAVKLAAVNTLGVLYIVETGEDIGAIEDLKGQTIYATGKGSTPEYALRHILLENGVDPDKDITIEWKSEPTEVVALLGQSGGVAMMPQPYVTVAQNTLPNLRVALDMTKEWDALDSGSMLITGVLVVRTAFAEEYPEQVAKFLEEYKASTEYVNANVQEAAALVEEFDIVKAAIAEKAIPYCNITYLDGETMKQAMTGYLQVLFDQNPKSVGGTLPGDDFYYQK
ncbi:MAG: MqnA/MqnD/SBP family protein [Clostridiales bacterium]